MFDLSILKHFVPLNGMHTESLRKFAASARVIRLEPGQVAFRQGDTDREVIYLLEGALRLSARGDSVERQVLAGSDESRYALSKLLPRQQTGIAKSPSVILRCDLDLLDQLLTHDQAVDYSVVEYEGADPEWMLQVLANPSLQKLPPTSFNGLFSSLEPLAVDAGQVVIREGDAGDCYYLIRSGQASVLRHDENGQQVTLAELCPGDGFGEEALLSGAPRNATVRMLTDGVLMRLTAQGFAELLRTPLVKQVDYAQMMGLMQDGAVLIDVRLEEEYRDGALQESVNIPLYLLRFRAKQLDAGRPYVVLCDTGSRSNVGAFLLSQRGLDAYVLRDGMKALPAG